MAGMGSGVPPSLAYHRWLQGTGLCTWLILGLPVLSNATREGENLIGARWIAWLVMFFAFGPALWISSSLTLRRSGYRMGSLLVESVAAIGMTYLLPSYFVGFLLVVVSWQLALFLPLHVAGIWALTNTVGLLYVLHPNYHMGWRWAAGAAYLGFQAFAIITAAMAKREALARQEEARMNAELASTRELLSESSRLNERVRISRELHDALGHHLAALSVQLEVALHSPPEQVPSCLEKAQSSSRALFQELRGVVGTLRDGEGIDLSRSLHALAERVPGLKLHLSVPDTFRVADPARAHAVLRCVQEIATNTIKHANASNLWIEIDATSDAIEITARDDGRGTDFATPGFGLSGMRERLEELGGGVSFASTSESGFSLRAWLPLAGGLQTA